MLYMNSSRPLALIVQVDHTFPPTLLLNPITNLYERILPSQNLTEDLETKPSLRRPLGPNFSSNVSSSATVQNSSFPPAAPAIGLPAEPTICAAPSFCSRPMYVLLVVFQASMYFSMQEERQVCSFEEREVEGLGIQVAKQFLGFRCQF